MKLTEQLGKAFTPGFLRPKMRNYFRAAGKDDIPYKTFGMIFLVCFALTLLIYGLVIYPAMTSQPLDIVPGSEAHTFAKGEMSITFNVSNEQRLNVDKMSIKMNLYNTSRTKTFFADNINEIVTLNMDSFKDRPAKQITLRFDNLSWDGSAYSISIANARYKPSVIKIVLLTFLFWVLVLLGLSILAYLGLYYIYDLKIYKRTKRIDKVLPEFLQFVSENLRSGMSFDQALWKAVRPEFDVLAAEIRIASKKVATGQDVDKALEEFTEKYRSPTLKRTFTLIIESIKGGGEMANIIDSIVDNLNRTSNLRQDVRTTSMNYVFFISIIVMGISPFMFAMAYQLLKMITSFTASLGGSMGTDMTSTLGQSGGSLIGNFASEAAIEPSNFIKFSIITMLVIGFFASMIVSTIRTGSIKGGIKYIPVYLIVSMLLYAIAMWIFSLIFGGIVI